MNPSILKEYTEIEWGKISRLRDLVSHHYEDVDHEIVYDICKNHIPQLETTIRKIVNQPAISKATKRGACPVREGKHCIEAEK